MVSTAARFVEPVSVARIGTPQSLAIGKTTATAIGAGALVFANLVAAVPGRVAAHTSTALVLRAE